MPPVRPRAGPRARERDCATRLAKTDRSRKPESRAAEGARRHPATWRRFLGLDPLAVDSMTTRAARAPRADASRHKRRQPLWGDELIAAADERLDLAPV